MIPIPAMKFNIKTLSHAREDLKFGTDQKKTPDIPVLMCFHQHLLITYGD